MKNKKSNILWGVILIAICVILVMSQLGMLGDLDIGLWSLLLTAMFGIWLVQSIIKIDFGGILFSAAFLLIIYDDVLGITELTPWTVLVVACLGSIALSMLFPKHSRTRNHRHHHRATNFEGEAHFSDVVSDDDGDVIYCQSSFGACTKYVHSQNLVKCYVNTKFGGAELFLTEADIKEEYAEVIVNGNFGGITIYVPRTWTITNDVDAIFGAVDFKNPDTHIGGGCKLLLTGYLKFGGLEIVYV